MNWLKKLLNGKPQPSTVPQRAVDDLAEGLAARLDNRGLRLEALRAMAELVRGGRTEEDNERRAD